MIGPGLYFMGIIDFLQPWNLRKKAELLCRVLFQGQLVYVCVCEKERVPLISLSYLYVYIYIPIKTVRQTLTDLI